MNFFTELKALQVLPGNAKYSADSNWPNRLDVIHKATRNANRHNVHEYCRRHSLGPPERSAHLADARALLFQCVSWQCLGHATILTAFRRSTALQPRI